MRPKLDRMGGEEKRRKVEENRVKVGRVAVEYLVGDKKRERGRF